jgi:hypothetical protein
MGKHIQFSVTKLTFLNALKHSPERFVELSLQSIIDTAGLKLKVAVEAA